MNNAFIRWAVETSEKSILVFDYNSAFRKIVVKSIKDLTNIFQSLANESPEGFNYIATIELSNEFTEDIILYGDMEDLNKYASSFIDKYHDLILETLRKEEMILESNIDDYKNTNFIYIESLERLSNQVSFFKTTYRLVNLKEVAIKYTEDKLCTLYQPFEIEFDRAASEKIMNIIHNNRLHVTGTALLRIEPSMYEEFAVEDCIDNNITVSKDIKETFCKNKYFIQDILLSQCL